MGNTPTVTSINHTETPSVDTKTSLESRMYLQTWVQCEITIDKGYNTDMIPSIRFYFEGWEGRSYYARTFRLKERYKDVECHIEGSEIVVYCDGQRKDLATENSAVLEIPDWAIKYLSAVETINETQEKVVKLFPFQDIAAE